MKQEPEWDFFAVDTVIGRCLPGSPTAAGISARLARLPAKIRSMVRLADVPAMAPDFGNRCLADMLKPYHPGLQPVWYVLPGMPESSWDEMRKNGGWLAWSRPHESQYSLTDWCAGDLLRRLSMERIPFLLSANDVTWEELHRCMEEFPLLRIILTDLSRQGCQIPHLRLMELHSNLYLTFTPTFSVHAGLAALIDKFGMSRFVWGMNAPASEPGAALSGILYSALSDKAVRAVVSENLLRLQEEAWNG